MCLFRAIALLLVTFATANLYAANGILPGNGTAESPYLIEDMADFDVFSVNAMYLQEDIHTKLMTDLDISSRVYSNIVVGMIEPHPGARYMMKGVFDGNNHTISNFFSYREKTATTGKGGGLFDVLDTTGTIKNLTIVDAVIQGYYYAGSNGFDIDVAVLCNRNFGQIENCHVSGKIDLYECLWNVGLLTGSNVDTGVIDKCSARGTIRLRSGWGFNNAGGLSGTNESGEISNSYADVDISCGYNAGSFCGWQSNYGEDVTGGIITNCYSHGSAVATYNVGGFIGHNVSGSIVNCYTTATATATTTSGEPHVGVFYGRSEDGCAYSNCIWGLSTQEIQDINTYLNAGWDIVPADQATADSLWVISENEYPKFTWSQPRNDVVCFDTETLNGMTETDAIAALADAGIIATVKYDCSRLVDVGKVIVVQPYSRFLRDTTVTVTIVVSTGAYDWTTNIGAGTIGSPYQVSTPGMLFGMFPDKCYELTTDLDLKGYSFPYGCVVRSDFRSDSDFSGCFDGKGHVIRNAAISGSFWHSMNIYITSSEYYFGAHYTAGCFSVIRGPNTVVKNFGVENVTISLSNNGAINEGKYVGGFVGLCDSPKSIYNCFVTGSLSSLHFVGGFAGYGVNIDSCYSSCSITNKGNNLSSSSGFAWCGYNISNCYATGDVSKSGAAASYGFISKTTYADGVKKCFAAVKVNDGHSSNFKGFGGSPSVLNCFWDATVSGDSAVTFYGAKGLPTAEMQNKATFVNAGWDFASDDGDVADWRMLVVGGYPRLVWEMNPDADASGVVNLADWSVFAQNWLGIGPACIIKSDLDGSGAIDMTDLEIFAENWLVGN